MCDVAHEAATVLFLFPRTNPLQALPRLGPPTCFLSLMFGARRASVTESLANLAGRGVIYTQRAQITVLDRSKLEAAAGDSYGVPEITYGHL
jgi:hypothetical protein